MKTTIKPLMTTEDVARSLRVCRDTVYRLAESGRLHSINVSGAKNNRKRFRFREEDVEEFIRGDTTPRPAPFHPTTCDGSPVNRTDKEAIAKLKKRGIEI
jgi:excisionase family DNA binding protein